MATGYILLPIPGGVAPDGSGSGNASARLEKVVSTGGQTTNTPKLSYYGLLFDPTTDQHWIWNFVIPGDWTGIPANANGNLRLQYSNKGTSANQIVWKTGVAYQYLSNWTTHIYNAPTLFTSTPETTIGLQAAATITGIDMTGIIPGLMISLFIGRDPDNASDTNASDMRLEGVYFYYNTT